MPKPLLEIPRDAQFQLEGLVGERLQANLQQWLLIAPQANPAMLEMFRDRERPPARGLVPWAGEFAGKYLTSAVLNLRLMQNPDLRDYLVGFVRDLIATQGGDGYLGPFNAEQRLFGKDLWDIWGHYHCMYGLLLWHQETGDEAALQACLRAADFLCHIFLDGDKRVIDAGSEEMNESVIHIFCLLHRQTGNPRYLQMAREIERDWETPPSGDYIRAALAGKPFYECPKPRWESLHGMQAIAELYYLTGEARYQEAFEKLWRSIQKGDRHNTGGFSSGEQATGNPYDPRAIETCCTIAWMALSIDMLRLTGDSTVADELELSTFNAMLGAQHPSGRWWTYNTPMDGERKASAHEIVFQARAGSPELNCCSVNGPRGLGMLAEWALMRAADGLALNYFGPGQISAALEDGRRVTIQQVTEYPRQADVFVHIDPEQPGPFALHLRIPRWSANTQVMLNSRQLPTPEPGRYLVLEHHWQRGDMLQLRFDFTPSLWHGERECAGKVSVFRGPLLLAYDPRFDQYAPDALPAIDLNQLSGAPVAWTQAPEPWMLQRFAAQDGCTINLCDFASAGACGTRYVSWLPA